MNSNTLLMLIGQHGNPELNKGVNKFHHSLYWKSAPKYEINLYYSEESEKVKYLTIVEPERNFNFLTLEKVRTQIIFKTYNTEFMDFVKSYTGGIPHYKEITIKQKLFLEKLHNKYLEHSRFDNGLKPVNKEWRDKAKHIYLIIYTHFNKCECTRCDNCQYFTCKDCEHSDAKKDLYYDYEFESEQQLLFRFEETIPWKYEKYNEAIAHEISKQIGNITCKDRKNYSKIIEDWEHYDYMLQGKQ